VRFAAQKGRRTFPLTAFQTKKKQQEMDKVKQHEN